MRLPVHAQSQVVAEPSSSLPGALGSTGFQVLRSIPTRGKGLRIAVIDSDFRGAGGIIGKSLPQNTRYIDLGSECDPTLTPASIAGSELGSGTRTALSLIRFAPLAIHPTQIDRLQLLGSPFHQGDDYLPSLMVAPMS